MKIDGAVPNDATAGHRDAGSSQSGNEWAHHANGGAHLTHDLIRRFGNNLGCGDFDSAAVTLNLATQGAEDLKHVVGVGNIGDALDDHLLISQQGSGEDGEGGILGTGNIDRSGKLSAAMNNEFIHRTVLARGFG